MTRCVPNARLLLGLPAFLCTACWVTDADRETWAENGGWGSPSALRSDWAAVAAGTFHTCGLHDDGTAECGCHGAADGDARCTAPEGSFVSIHAYDNHTCALADDGQVTCWGDGELAAPAGVFTEVDVGDYAACGVADSGWLLCWGFADPFRLVAQDTLVTNIAVGPDGNVCGLDDEGAIHCWCDVYDFVCEPPAGGFVSLSLGCEFGCALAEDGAVTCWGGGCGQDVGQRDPPTNLRTLELESKGGCGITNDSEVACWGSGDLEQAPGGPFVDVDRGRSQACAVGVDGSMNCWGRDATSP